MKLDIALSHVTELMSRFVFEIKGNASMGRTDLNKAAETILIPLLNEVHGWNLENVNYSEDNPNYPGIDLADKEAKVCVQVTATTSLDKIKHTLRQFSKHEQYLTYDRLIVYILKEKQQSYSDKAIQDIVQDSFKFDVGKDIWDYQNLLKEISNFQIEKVTKIQDILEANFGESGQYFKRKTSHSLSRVHNLPKRPYPQLSRIKDLNELKKIVLAYLNESLHMKEYSCKVGMHGMGGIGKSALATILAHEEDIQAAFPDGVFWITLGQEPPLTLRQSNFAEMLGDGYRTLQDVHQGKIHLSQLLEGKTCLLVLDDAWKIEHVAAFDVLSEQSRLLFTTRDKRIVTSLNATEYSVNLLDDDEALELLAAYSGQKQALPPEAHQIVKECGNLPLALSMIGAIAKARPNRWQNLLNKLQNADLDKIRHQFPDYPHPDLLKAIQVSVDALDSNIKTRYLDFAIFPEDAAVPEATLGRLWEPEGLDQYYTQDVIDTLVERSLARRDEAGSLSLHDLQRDYVKRQNSDLPALHNRLLDAYSSCCPDGWCTGPNDGYFFENLAYHLEQAGRKAELYALLTTCPDWMEAKSIHCLGDSSYNADLALALRSLIDPLNPQQILWLVRIYTAQLVISERVSQYSKEDLEALVWLEREAEAINNARLTQESIEKFLKLLTIYDALQKKEQYEPSLLDEIWEATQHIENDQHEPLKTWALRHVATRLHAVQRFEEAKQVLSKACESASTIHPSWIYTRSHLGKTADSPRHIRYWVQVNAFIQLATAFHQCQNQDETENALEQAQQIANRIDDPLRLSGSYKTRDQCFGELAIAMSRLGYLERAKSVAQLINDIYHASEAWRELLLAFIEADYPQSEIELAFTEAKKLISQIEKLDTKVDKLSQLAIVLYKGSKFYKREAENILSEIPKFIETISPESGETWEWQRIHSLSSLAIAYAQLGNFTSSIEVADNIENTRHKRYIFSKIVDFTLEAKDLNLDKVKFFIYDRNLPGLVITKLATALAKTGEVNRASELFAKARKEVYQSVLKEDWRFKVQMLYEIALALIEAKQFKVAEACIQSMKIHRNSGSFHKADALIQLGLALSQDKLFKGDSDKILKTFLEAEKEIRANNITTEHVELFHKLISVLIDLGYSEEADRISTENEKNKIYAVGHIISYTDNNPDLVKTREERKRQKEKSIQRLISNGCFTQAFAELDSELNDFESFICFLAKEAHTFEIIESGLLTKVLSNSLDIASWLDNGWKEIKNIVHITDEI